MTTDRNDQWNIIRCHWLPFLVIRFFILSPCHSLYHTLSLLAEFAVTRCITILSFHKRLLRKKCPYSELFWSVFSRILTEYWEIRNEYGPEKYVPECGKIPTRITPNTYTFQAVDLKAGVIVGYLFLNIETIIFWLLYVFLTNTFPVFKNLWYFHKSFYYCFLLIKRPFY